jgi:hypothetical protein
MNVTDHEQWMNLYESDWHVNMAFQHMPSAERKLRQVHWMDTWDGRDAGTWDVPLQMVIHIHHLGCVCMLHPRFREATASSKFQVPSAAPAMLAIAVVDTTMIVAAK